MLDKNKDIKKGISYIRVSKSREKMLTVDTQQEKIKKYCDLHDITLIGEYQDIDFSGRTVNRPDFQKLLDDIQSGIIEPDFLLVYKLDRFSRSVREFYENMSLLEKNNVNLVSITQNFDTSTPMGRVMVGILIQFAQFESEMTGMRIKDNLISNANKGRWNGGIVPYGYVWDEDTRTLKPRPEEAATVREIFRSYCKGEASTTIAKRFAERGIISPSGQEFWNNTTITYMVRNKIYAGKIEYAGEVNPGVHEGLVSDETFRKANEMLDNNELYSNRGNTYLLTSLTRCKQCGSHGYIKLNGPDKKIRYVCSNRNENTKSVCASPFLDAGTAESAVIKALFELLDEPDTFRLLKKSYKDDNQNDEIQVKENKLRKEIKKIDQALNKLYEDYYMNQMIPESQFVTFSTKYETTKEKLLEDLDVIEKMIIDIDAITSDIDFIEENIKYLKDCWDSLSIEDQNRALRQIIKQIYICDDSILIDLFYFKKRIHAWEIKRGVLYF